MPSRDEETKALVAGFLPEAIIHAVQSYVTFSQQAVDYEPREFSAYHAACKNALAHLDSLLKLKKNCGDDRDVQSGREDHIRELLKLAKEQLNAKKP